MRFFISVVISFVFIFHLGATTLYLAPTNPLTKHYISYVKSYMEPIFSQNWNLFAPEPATSSLKLWYRCQDKGKQWNEWQDPIHSLITQHQKNRFTFRGKLIYVYQSLSRNLLNTYVGKQSLCLTNDSINSCAKKKEELAIKTQEFKLTQTFITQLCKNQLKDKLASTQFQILKVFPLNYSQRHEKRPYGKLEKVTFSPVKI